MSIKDFVRVALSEKEAGVTQLGTVDDFLHEQGRTLAQQYAASAHNPAWQPHYDLLARYLMTIDTGADPDLLIEIDFLRLHQNDQMVARGLVFAPTDTATDARSRCIQFRVALAPDEGKPLVFRDLLRVAESDVLSGVEWSETMAPVVVESELKNFLQLHARLLGNTYKNMLPAQAVSQDQPTLTR